MRYNSGGKEDDLRYKFWEAMSESSFLFLQLDGDPTTAVPMSAQLDKDADSSIWFFTQKQSDFAKLGGATATFAGKDHKMWARFHGNLTVETSKERFDKFWNNFVEAWYDEGKTDPDLLFLRMDLGDAEIWNGDMGILNVAKMALGKNVHDDAAKKHTETKL
ncbi:MAG: pyridoxamine 5'-phosphate oxidase family protein [Pontixanthobacter sp.]